LLRELVAGPRPQRQQTQDGVGRRWQLSTHTAHFTLTPEYTILWYRSIVQWVEEEP
jgi:hypothetical protein